MSSLILCHKKKAKNAYMISQISRRIYTLEELCYYLCHHLYLIDYTFMNGQLCDWMDEELELKELASELRRILEQHGSMEQFVMTILSGSMIYSMSELKQMQEVLDHLKNQKSVEKQKYKADTLLESGSIKAAIMAYREIVHGVQDESIDGKFYGKVYASLGAAYGRMFLYEEAAKMYETAYQICEDKAMLKAYLYACRCYQSKESYEKLLQRSVLYQETDAMLTQEIADLEQSVRTLHYEDGMEQWKKQYRRISTGEI